MIISKRTGKILTLIVAFIMSIALVVALKTYLTDSQIQISFNVSPSITGKYRATFYFTDEKGKNIDQNNTNNIVSQDKNLISGEYTQIEFKTLIKPHKKVQKFQLTLLYLGDPNEVEGSSADIKEIQLNREPIDLLKDHLNKITFKDNNAIYIQPNDLNLRPRYTHLALYGVLIIIFIGTGVLYKLICFVLNQRARQHTRSADLAFIIVITVTIMIPAMGINTTPNISAPDENRMLSEYKPFFTDDWQHPINLNYMKDFENWFNDRFGIRKKLYTQIKNLERNLNSISYGHDYFGSFCQSSNGWCFRQDELNDLSRKFNSEFIPFSYIKELVTGTNKPIYLLIYPFKTELYYDKIEFLNKVIPSKNHFSDVAYSLFSRIKKTNFNVINLTNIFKNNLEKEPSKLLFFADEHHATEYANYLTISYLINNKILKTNHTDKRFIFEKRALAFGEFLSNTDVYYGQTWGNVFGHSNRTKIKKMWFSRTFPYHQYDILSYSKYYNDNIFFKVDNNCPAKINLHNKTAKNYKVYVLGESFTELFSKVLATTVSDVYRRRINTPCGETLNVKNVLKEIKNIDPDIIIIPYWAYTSMIFI